MSGSPEEVKKHIGVYLKVAGALGVGTVVTVLASFLDVAIALGIVIALIIALTKGSLVVAFFMHLLEERSKAILWTLALTATFWFFLMLLPLFTMSDHIGTPKTLSNADAAEAHAEEAH
ncbi:uncharacterized protein METZ01_LOCUS66673 [marine metagenome]|uniref:Caa(3)-type oxidase subunit IV n=1 Tax=marine metagenome TaxID=408172 RepID=A0A381TDI9_9ZZZZ